MKMIRGKVVYSTTELSAIAGMQVPAALVEKLGVTPAATAIWRGTYWYDDDLPAIWAALSKHFEELK